MISKTFSLGEIADKVGGEVLGDGGCMICGIASIDEASAGQISFVGNKKYAAMVAASGASAVIVGRDFDVSAAGSCSLVVCDRPNTAFATVVSLFAPPAVAFQPGVHPSAVVSESAVVGDGCHVGACAVIGDRTVVGDKTVVGAGTVLGSDVVIGRGCLLYPNVSIRERCVVGDRVIVHCGTVIGSDGFGFEAGPEGIVKIPQVGIVQVDDDVEIGANCTIDRARFGRTWLKRGVKIDNLVQVAHNVEVGEFSMLIGQSGVAGSAKIGRGVIVAAQAGVNGHIRIGDGAQVAGTSGVLKDLPPGARVAGTPAEPQKEFMTRFLLPKTVEKLRDRVAALEKIIRES
ncbi:MAG: UDP-3-O-(3-hydroxymyristoyl)glucosamine N-acyltransferase [Victivallales bacterium]|nr:UDP-3-O-(3-hydroxymyristoyl)glucosamine N-acyltransferase [Victivallales bacterium]